MITDLKLRNFRNFSSAALHFERRKVLFCGANGAGKSNLLESLAFAGTLRSFRTMRLTELVMHQEPSMQLRTVLQMPHGRTELEIELLPPDRRKLFIDRRPTASGRDFIQYLLPVVLAPEDRELMTGGAAGRRRFADMTLSLLDDGYLNVLHDYVQALRQRNAALKRQRPDPAILESFERLLAVSGAELIRKRRSFTEALNRELQALTPGVLEVVYQPRCSGGAEELAAEFSRQRRREIERRQTLTGPHLDEYLMLRNGQSLRSFGSNGQCRLAALNLKLAELNLLKKDGSTTGKRVIVLADDVTGELDSAAKERFYAVLDGADQLFFTFTARPDSPFFQDAQEFHVESGKALPA